MNRQNSIEYYINPPTKPKWYKPSFRGLPSTFFIHCGFLWARSSGEEKILVYGTKNGKDGSKQFKNAFFFLFHLLIFLLIFPTSIVK
jgi:hypothetical protein